MAVIIQRPPISVKHLLEVPTLSDGCTKIGKQFQSDCGAGTAKKKTRKLEVGLP